MAVFIMLNNYFHDLATALMACSAIVIFVLVRNLDNETEEAKKYFLKLYPKLTKLARFSLAWIIWGGAIRMVAYRAYEWSDAASRAQIPALVAKHIIIFIVVAVGIYMWRKLSVKVKNIRIELQKQKKDSITEEAPLLGES